MGYNAVLIDGFGIVAVAAAWLLRHSVLPLGWRRSQSALSALLFVGAENTTNGRCRVPILSHRIHGPHPAHHAIVELRGAFERMQRQLQAVLPRND